MRYLLAGIGISLCLYVLTGCVGDLTTSGAGGQTTNGITVSIVYAGGKAAAGLPVRVRPSDYLAKINGISEKSFRSVVNGFTDMSGRFRVDSLESGSYVVEVNDGHGYAIAFKHQTLDSGGIVNAGTDTLIPTGAVHGHISPNELSGKSWYVQVYGLERITAVDQVSGAFIFNDLPSGNYTFRLISADSTITPIDINNIQIRSADTATIPAYTAWRYNAKLMLNTTSSGANVKENVLDFPVLIRLTSGNFNFSQAQAKGEDIRFTKADGTPMSFEIEQWDATLQSAAIWVKVDTVYGNDSLQFINMYWGNSAAAGASNSAIVFDTSKGFQGVWHLGEAGNSTALDATGNKFDGTPYSMTAASAVQGITGGALHFDGASSYIQMENTASSKLNFKQNDVFSISAWVNLDTVTAENQMVAGKGILQYYLKCKPPLLGYCYEFAEYCDNDGWYTTTSDTINPVAKTWAYMVGIREGTKQQFYLNGELVGSILYKTPNTLPRDESEDFSIGRYLKEAVSPNPPEGFCYFNGIIDEVRIMNTAPGADWVRLCYMNQKEIDALVKW